MIMNNFDNLIKEYHKLCQWYDQHKQIIKPKIVQATKPTLRVKLNNRVVETQEVL